MSPLTFRARWLAWFLCTGVVVVCVGCGQTAQRSSSPQPAAAPRSGPTSPAVGDCQPDDEHPIRQGVLPPASTAVYETALRAMGEGRLCVTGSGAEAYRFLWLRSADAPVAVRFERRGTGYVVAAKELARSTSGAPSPPALVRDESRQVTAAEWRAFLNLLDAADYWSLPAEGTRTGPGGARWVLEGVRSRAYHVVDLWSPEAEGQRKTYREACLYLVRLAGLEVEAARVY